MHYLYSLWTFLTDQTPTIKPSIRTWFQTWQGNKSDISIFGFFVGAYNYTATLPQNIVNSNTFVKVEVWEYASTSSVHSYNQQGSQDCFPPVRGVVVLRAYPGWCIAGLTYCTGPKEAQCQVWSYMDWRPINQPVPNKHFLNRYCTSFTKQQRSEKRQKWKRSM